MDMLQDFSCLEQYVGLRGLCEVIDGGVFLNDLPGIEAKTFSNAATSEDGTGLETFLRLRREAARQTGKAFLRKMDDKYTVEDVVDQFTIGDLDSARLTPTETFTLENYHPQTSLHLERLRIWADRTGNVELTVNGVTTSLVALEGFNSYLRKDSGDKLEVALTGIDGLQLARADYRRTNCGTCHTGYKGTLAAEATVTVRPDQILCLYAEQLADASRFMLAALLMEEVEYSDRSNPLVRNGKESAGRIRARVLGTEDPVTGIKQPSSFWAELGSVVKRAKLSGPGISSSGLRYVEVIP